MGVCSRCLSNQEMLKWHELRIALVGVEMVAFNKLLGCNINRTKQLKRDHVQTQSQGAEACETPV